MGSAAGARIFPVFPIAVFPAVFLPSGRRGNSHPPGAVFITCVAVFHTLFPCSKAALPNER